MKVIIRKDVPALGKAGEVKNVRDGYARNYLLPRRMAELATDGALKNWKLGAQRRSDRAAKETAEAKALAGKMEGLVLSFTRAAGEDGKLFGSVGKSDIWKSVKASGHEIAKEAVDIAAPIKTVGDTDVTLRLAQGVTATVKIRIAAKAQ
ncbi:MAG: 50S ribosomal protein L9 [Elusimicrobiales bacterium]